MNNKKGKALLICMIMLFIIMVGCDNGGQQPFQPVLVSSITVRGEDGHNFVTVDAALQMQATILPANATNKQVTWSVENQPGTSARTLCATIDSTTGLLSGLAAGLVTVRASASDGSGVQGTMTVTVTAPATPQQAIIANSQSVDLLSIPMEFIELIKGNDVLHYGQRSHGSQINHGLQSISDSNATYAFAGAWCGIPASIAALKMWYGQIDNDYVAPEDYWSSPAGLNTTRTILQNNPTIKYSMWSWCTELDEWTALQVQDYLNAIQNLESEFPEVTFIYMTSTAQSDGAEGWNRAQRNQQIRDFCIDNHKVLFDFEDLDSTYQGTQQIAYYQGSPFPIQHPDFYGDYQWTHVNQQGCEIKAKAIWWILARLNGWDGDQEPVDQEYIITVEASPEQGGNVRIDEGTWAKTLTNTVDAQSQVTIEAQSIDPYTFQGWYSGATSISSNLVHTFNAQESMTFQARFQNEVVGSSRIMPEDLEYLGAFLTPGWQSDPLSWVWGGQAMAYHGAGDPEGIDDGFVGSIFGAGHEVFNLISEIDIPVPIISPTKNVADLNLARVLQPFTDVQGGMFNWIEEMPRVGLEILPAQGEQTQSKLYLCWGAHLQDEHPSHMWCETNLSDPQPQGAWHIQGGNPYNVNDYLFEIPENWANENTPGMRLATGRYRDGGWSGLGPTVMAIGPWNEGNPPSPGTTLSSIPLIQYANWYEGEPDPWTEMEGYAYSDEWSGAAWLTAGDKAAVVFVGTKGIGDTWYGDTLGPCVENCTYPWQRGWWSDTFEGWFLFYDPEDLAKVAQGTMQPHEPQPYAFLNIDEHLFYVEGQQQKRHLGACTYDRQNHLFYVFEPGLGNGEKSTLVHVWRIKKVAE